MTIRTRVRLLSGIALLGILLFIGAGLVEQRERYRRQVAVSRQIHGARQLLEVIHQLQKERGHSAGFLGTPSPPNRDSLVAQHAATDAALRNETPGQGLQFQTELGTMRSAILLLQVSAAEAQFFYTREIDRILAGLAQAVQSSNAPDLRRNLTALIHLFYAKESLGQIRARLSLDLAEGQKEALAGYEIARHDALFHYHLRAARHYAPASLATALEHTLTLPRVQETLKTAALAGSSGRRQVQLSPELWFAMASETIDHFKSMEEDATGLLTDQADTLLAVMRRDMLLDAAIAATVASMIVLLAALTMRRMLHPLHELLTSVRGVVETRDFTIRLPVRRDDEIGTIAHGFNELLETVHRLMHEKDDLARTDILTGAANRLAFSEALARELARKRRYPGPLSLVMFDLDHFKRVNDTYGHDEGDEVLRAVARVVTQTVRQTDIFARWGGEEFIILAPDSPGEDAARLAEKLRSLLEQHPFPIDGRLTASFGIASLVPDDDAESLTKRADRALYRAKAAGRNRVIIDHGSAPVLTSASS